VGLVRTQWHRQDKPSSNDWSASRPPVKLIKCVSAKPLGKRPEPAKSWEFLLLSDSDEFARRRAAMIFLETAGSIRGQRYCTGRSNRNWDRARREGWLGLTGYRRPGGVASSWESTRTPHDLPGTPSIEACERRGGGGGGGGGGWGKGGGGGLRSEPPIPRKTIQRRLKIIQDELKLDQFLPLPGRQRDLEKKNPGSK
jgi:hypothetical protein